MEFVHQFILLLNPVKGIKNGHIFDEIIFGPVKSRRLGVSLGINLLPTKKKDLQFQLHLLECGWTSSELSDNSLPQPGEMSILL